MAGQGGKALAAANLTMLREAAVSYACVLLWIALSATVIVFNKYLFTYSGEIGSSDNTMAVLHQPALHSHPMSAPRAASASVGAP
jgi:hypothetical protein